MGFLFLICIILALILLIAHKYLSEKESVIIEQIDSNLPQVNCGKCGFAGCKAFANALANDETQIQRCHLLDQDSAENIAKILGVELSNKPLKTDKVALIDESICIGCTKCALNCPTDCIIGSAKQVHTVIQNNCIGCGVCVQNCPVNAIKMVKKLKVEIK